MLHVACTVETSMGLHNMLHVTCCMYGGDEHGPAQYAACYMLHVRWRRAWACTICCMLHVACTVETSMGLHNMLHVACCMYGGDEHGPAQYAACCMLHVRWRR